MSKELKELELDENVARNKTGWSFAIYRLDSSKCGKRQA